MDYKVVEKKKDMMELEFDEKEMPVALANQLQKSGVDAYWYEPHPLIKGFRVHIDSETAEADLKKAVASLNKEWSELSKALKTKLK
jgi:DNA-directed RNA polymerase subunit L